ncbi:MAG: rhomboid family intramembrane serine protease [Planctomycetaceae bacterium]|nr:rhomboid family intramembrane serine protease [Planctomycetaceae bacterium]
MGIHDRDYHQPDYEGSSMPRMQFRFPPLTPVVKYLLIINVGIYLLSIIVKPIGNFLYGWLEIDSSTTASSLQLWRVIGYQFLHDPRSVGHIFMNMIGLYFLGPTLERFWHSKKFLIFYLACGAAGGLYYILLSNLGAIPKGELIGASGAILGMLAACAILFPHFVVILLVFPVPIRVASVLLICYYVINIFIVGQNAGGDAAHLAGMATGAAYVYFGPKLKNRYKASLQDNWEKKFRAYSELQKEVDRILEKVNQQGINSLTKKEKQILAEATRLEQMKNKL